MVDKKNATKIVVGLALASILFTPQAWAYGWEHGRSHRSFHHHQGPYPSYGKVTFSLPRGHISLSIGRARYYYCDGVFYHRDRREYVVVVPPVGAVVNEIPYDFEPVVIRGVTYYVHHGTYFQYTPHGFEVIPAPGEVVVTKSDGVIQSHNFEDTFTVNIPNKNGGYTAVTLKNLGNGYVGPQGEFYSEFPRVEQLKVMYAGKT